MHRHSYVLPSIAKASLTRARAARVGDRAPDPTVLHPPGPFRIEPALDRVAYVRVRGKFALAVALSLAWLAFTIWFALPWMHDLARLTNWPVALFIIGGIALIPGLMNAFLAASLLLDRRPPRQSYERYPPISILIAACNEEHSILGTLESLATQNYPGELDVIVIDDGSTDRTATLIETLPHPWLSGPASSGSSFPSTASAPNCAGGSSSRNSSMPGPTTSTPHATANGRPDWPCASAAADGSGPEPWRPGGKRSMETQSKARHLPTFAQRAHWARGRA